MKNYICIFLVFILCFTVCACSKETKNAAETTQNIPSQTINTTQSETEESTTAQASETATAAVNTQQSKAEISTKNQWTKPTRSNTTERITAPTYATDINGYVTIPNVQITAPESEPETVYIVTDVKSNIGGKTELSGIKLTVDRYSGALLYVNYTIKPGNNLYQNSDFILQKLVNGQWTDMEQIREIDAGKTAVLNRGDGYIYSLPEYYHLDKYINNPEDCRYKIKPNFCTDINMKNSAGYEIEFTVTKQTVKTASLLQKIENPISAEFSFASYSMDYSYTFFDKRQLTRLSQLYNNLKFTPIEIPDVLYSDYLLTVIDSNGNKHSLVLCNNGVTAYQNGSGNYYYVENSKPLYDYLNAICLNS